ncbi:hypothetical protein PINS_up008369 [Pythium insidiosum]|nr:hypothetical protein PINS_up008369 [Pythium insidiosum]
MLWYAVCVMEIVKLSVYAFTLSRIDWGFMARRAVETMEATGEEEAEALEESMNIALSEAGNTPLGFSAVQRSPSTQLLTPTSRRAEWERLEERLRQSGATDGDHSSRRSSPQRSNSFSHA